MFCQRCGEPIRCQSCGAALLADARACIQCGTHIPGRDSADSRFAHAGGVAPGYNRLTVREKSDSYSFDADFVFTNEFGGQAGVSDVIANLGGFGERAANSRPTSSRPAQSKVVVESVQQQPTTPQLTSGANNASHTAAPIEPDSDTGPMTAKRAIQEVFMQQDGKLILKVADLKASSQKDYTFRLVHIYIFARMTLFGETSIHRVDLYDVTDYAGLARDNVQSYIAQDPLISRDGDSLSFKVGGVQHAEKTLLDIVSSDAPGLWPPSADSLTASRSKKIQRRSSNSRADDETIAKVLEHPETKALVVDIPHSVIVGMGVMDKTIVALYGLHRAGIEGEVHYPLVEAYLYSIFDTSVKAKTIGNTLRDATPPASNYFVRRPGGGYRITQSGSEYVESKFRSKPSSNGQPVQTALVEP